MTHDRTWSIRPLPGQCGHKSFGLARSGLIATVRVDEASTQEDQEDVDRPRTDLTNVRGGGKVIRDGKLTDNEYLDAQIDP